MKKVDQKNCLSSCTWLKIPDFDQNVLGEGLLVERSLHSIHEKYVKVS